jgi:LemA protein
VQSIPGKFFTGLAKVDAREFYEIDDPAAREVPKVQF